MKKDDDDDDENMKGKLFNDTVLREPATKKIKQNRDRQNSIACRDMS